MATLQLEGLGKLKKKSMISSGLEPATFWLVPYSLNHLRYCVPHQNTVCISYLCCVIIQTYTVNFQLFFRRVSCVA
jgi:hypothetical protein